MIEFIEHQTPGYAPRTIRNCEKTNITLAIGCDYNTAGEILTEKATKIAEHPYLWIQLQVCTPADIEKVKAKIISFKLKKIHIHIAGNGIYTLKKWNYDQDSLNVAIGGILSDVLSGLPIEDITTGGQTGVDEAALHFADAFKIPAICCFAKGWLFRNIDGVDIADKEAFLNRFHPVYNVLY